MNWKLIASTGVAVAGLVVLPGVITAKSTDPVEQQGGKAKIHHTKVYTVASEAARILKNVEEQAYEVTDHAGTIRVAGGLPTISRDFHVVELEAIKEDVNAMGAEMQRLQGLKENEASWEQRTVTRAMPLLTQVAATTDEAIRFVNDNPQKLGLPQYQQISRRLYDQSTALWKAVHDSVKLADLRIREDRLRKSLQNIPKPSE